MKSFEINSVKGFMNELLCRETFDAFLLAEASIVSKASLVLDGHVTEDYLNEEELKALGLRSGSCVPYGQMRDLCFSFIKGKVTPKFFRFVLLANQEMIDRILSQGDYGLNGDDIGNLSLTVRFFDGKLAAMSSCTLTKFTMDKSLEYAWDQYVTSFFSIMNLL